MEIKFKKLVPEAVIPQRANPTDAGLDLVATEVVSVFKDFFIGDGEGGMKHNGSVLQFIEYKTGIAIEIPEGFVGLLFPRSSVTKQDLMLKNSVGVIDSGYRGEIMLRFKSIKPESTRYEIGDKIGQLLIVPIALPTLIEVDELSDTSRGEGGFGSTGK